ncbi:energy coupling factor transporter S component ThiW [Vagococcus fluvialis]|uniref:energy coupling factor transporter S component ThiW n=1 Tax=Vagococcus fluvialis TaxID=2738 RepID=UPI0028909AEC|nr:energy coupling factor transporter S component ThiW [Vagococcus fluvialis]MDT2746034.1 energy coupling factor transporter S component ThiW [Vagococcus fluvialis]
MPQANTKLQKLIILSLMIALDVVLSPLFRIEGMAPMSSVMNVIGVALIGPMYGTAMALICGILRMLLLGVPPLALTGAVFGAFLAGIGYKYTKSIYGAMVGEIIGTGLIGSLLSYPIMVWFTGSAQGMYWFIYTPRFFGGAISGSLIGFLVYQKLKTVPKFIQLQAYFKGEMLHGTLTSKEKNR